MNMIWHDDKRMQLITVEAIRPVVHRVDDQIRNGVLSEIERPCTNFIQQPIHRRERLTGAKRIPWESTMRGQAPTQPPSEESFVPGIVDVR